ncbi:unnamed protein product [Ectocarpus sp. 12 AP-2014]
MSSPAYAACVGVRVSLSRSLAFAEADGMEERAAHPPGLKVAAAVFNVLLSFVVCSLLLLLFLQSRREEIGLSPHAVAVVSVLGLNSEFDKTISRDLGYRAAKAVVVEHGKD